MTTTTYRSDENFKLLIQSFLLNEISACEFSDKFIVKWRDNRDSDASVQLDPRFQRLIDRIFTSCDAYDPNPENKWEINNEQLLQEIELLAYIWWGICKKVI